MAEAESDWGKLDHRAPLARAAVSMPAPDLDGVHQTINSDPVTYGPLTNPDAPNEHGWSPPADPIPTELELRGKLVEALEAQRECDAKLTEAQAASDRAARHLDRCGNALRSFDNLDNAIAEATIEQLISDAARVELPDALSDRIGERDRARATHVAALRASEVLAADLVAARGKAAEAASKVDRLICGILNFEAARVAAEHAAFIERAAAIAEMLFSYNHFSANKGIVMPPSVRRVLGSDVPTLARQRDKSVWLNAADVLRNNPQAEVRVYG